MDKSTRVLELIAAYRSRGHLMADIDPLMMDSDARRAHPDLRIETYGADPVGPRPHLPGRRVPRQGTHEAARRALDPARRVLPPRGRGIHPHPRAEQQRWLQERVEIKHVKPPVGEQKYIVSKLNAAEAFETFLATKYVGQKRFSLGARSR